MSNKILIVDDEPNILSAFRRQLRGEFNMEFAEGPERGLEMIAANGPFAVVVSDMRMPGMSGVEFLVKVASTERDTVRMMLTGNADQETATSAVNEGRIFCFLNKPCSPEMMAKALRSALEQYRLIMAEHELLSKTLSGSVGLLTDMLAMVNPTAFGRSGRIRHLARSIAEALGMANAWEVEVAAMLCQIGCVAIPPETMTRYFNDERLTPQEQVLVRAYPQIGHDLVAKIPRLQNVAVMICRLGVTLKVNEAPATVLADSLTLGAHILTLVLSYDAMAARLGPPNAVRMLHDDPLGRYDARAIKVLADLIDVELVIRQLRVAQLRPGMYFEDHLLSGSGEVLVAKGQLVTEALLSRLDCITAAQGIREPVRVRCPASADVGICQIDDGTPG